MTAAANLFDHLAWNAEEVCQCRPRSEQRYTPNHMSGARPCITPSTERYASKQFNDCDNGRDRRAIRQYSMYADYVAKLAECNEFPDS